MAAGVMLIPYGDLEESGEVSFEWKTQRQELELLDSFHPFPQAELSRQDVQLPISAPAETENEGSREEQSGLSVRKHERDVKMESEEEAACCCCC
ncbi:uncharacterized protein LOC103164176 [Cricetulus griseus]|uniref:Uncharacterized LOC103164176 n=1 Tax=Cricetulus griseus TaxID=10029 RepID=G3HXX6_CRIGR|nr:uncharacterized protein LOC103164176 [Cricetulus griseus]XP_027263159.1 uncharacterized protein LOC103164176 [Cricetulus griseus]EGV95166.1 hypothetical protein I79_015892 [Cricetulus griseus]ERE80346.1 hypothetical protein H671_3g8919 [Cricetulus griseus]